jgi:hypothetical protein
MFDAFDSIANSLMANNARIDGSGSPADNSTAEGSAALLPAAMPGGTTPRLAPQLVIQMADQALKVAKKDVSQFIDSVMPDFSRR